MLDGEAEAEGSDYFSIGGVDHSPDHRWLAWSRDDKGSEFYDLTVRDLDTGKDTAELVADTSGGVAWDAARMGSSTPASMPTTARAAFLPCARHGCGR